MKLLHLAHRGEAQSFLTEFKLRPIMQGRVDLYEGSEFLLLIGGEGVYPTLEKVSFVLGKFPEITEVINLGICGLLDSTLATLDEIYAIRSVYAYEGTGPLFNSYHSDGTIDLVTSYERVTTPESAQKLLPVAPLVDRELWAVARACNLAGIKFQSFKLTSDIAGEELCMDIRNRALEYSQKLLNYFRTQLLDQSGMRDVTSKKIEIEFYSTKQQKIMLHKLLSALSLKYRCSEEEILGRIGLAGIEKLEITEKQRTAIILDELQTMLNPLKAKVQNELQHFAANLQEIGASVNFDPSLEKKEFTLQMRINHQTNIEKLKHALTSTQFERFESIMEGHLK